MLLCMPRMQIIPATEATPEPWPFGLTCHHASATIKKRRRTCCWPCAPHYLLRSLEPLERPARAEAPRHLEAFSPLCLLAAGATPLTVGRVTRAAASRTRRTSPWVCQGQLQAAPPP